MVNGGVPLAVPRNIQQMRNLCFKVVNRNRISHDALYNLNEIAYDVPGFIWKITTHPDLVCVCGLKQLFEEMDRVLLLKGVGLILSYDTTFQLGDFYVSPLIFRQVLFRQQPSIPVAFLLQERKYAQTHEELFHVVCQ